VLSAHQRKEETMTDRIKRTLQSVAVLAAVALGAAAVGSAVTGNGSPGSSNATTTAAQPPSPGQSPWLGSRPRHQGEQLLTGSTAQKVREAALAKVPGGTIQRVETDADGHAAYEAHMQRSDGSLVTVYVNEQFEVVSVENGR
jgi:uncharacterized membrane protein YkoI